MKFVIRLNDCFIAINLNSMNKKRIPMEIEIVFGRYGSIKTTIRLLVNATQQTMIIKGIIGASLFPDRMVGRHTSISNANNAAEIKYVGSIFWLIFSMIIILFSLFLQLSIFLQWYLFTTFQTRATERSDEHGHLNDYSKDDCLSFPHGENERKKRN